MIPLLRWQDFELNEDRENGTLRFTWGWARASVLADSCEAISLRAYDGGQRLILRFRGRTREDGGLLVVRVQVPEAHQHRAREIAELLRRAYGIPEAIEHEQDDELPTRVPSNDPQWVVSPTAAVSDELYAQIFAGLGSKSRA